MSDIVIRPFQPLDTAVAQSLIGELQNYEKPLNHIILPWEDVKDAYWKWLLSNIEKKSGFMFLAEDGKNIVGVVTGWIEETEFPRIKPEECRFGYICDMAVAPSARQKGVGTLLMKVAEKFFLEKNIRIVKLMTFANNDLANDFYANYGMQKLENTYKKYLAGAP